MDLLPRGADATSYRLLTTEGVRALEAAGRTFLRVDAEAIRRLTAEAVRDLGRGWLRGEDPGTAIVVGSRSEGVLTAADDGEAISRGLHDACTALGLHSRQRAPLTTFEEKDTGTLLPAQIEIHSTPQTSGRPAYTFCFMTRSGDSATASALFQETKALLTPQRLLTFLDERIRSLGASARPPRHLGVVIGGTSAEVALRTATYAAAGCLDHLPVTGSMSAHGFRDLDLEQQVLALGGSLDDRARRHDVRVVRLPRHAGSLPVALAVSGSADRRAWGAITADGVLLERVGTDAR